MRKFPYAIGLALLVAACGAEPPDSAVLLAGLRATSESAPERVCATTLLPISSFSEIPLAGTGDPGDPAWAALDALQRLGFIGSKENYLVTEDGLPPRQYVRARVTAAGAAAFDRTQGRFCFGRLTPVRIVDASSPVPGSTGQPETIVRYVVRPEGLGAAAEQDLRLPLGLPEEVERIVIMRKDGDGWAPTKAAIPYAPSLQAPPKAER